MIRLHVQTHRLELKHPFRIARGEKTHQETMIVVLERNGVFGYGEATVNNYYGTTLEEMQQQAEQVRHLVEQEIWLSPEALWAILHPFLKDAPFVHCAIDVAAHDLAAREAQLPLYQYWGLKWDNIPLSSYTIGLGPISVMVAKLKEMPWPVYKIKLGTDHDLAIVEALREVTDAPFWVDANASWTLDKTQVLATAFQNLGVEFIEQPLPAEHLKPMETLLATSSLPFIADESCQHEEDIDHCFRHFNGVNIKVMKCGGFTPALRMIHRARALGMKVMVGCMTESSAGISAIAHLLPLLDYADMDGALLLKDDIGSGVRFEAGVAVPAEGWGSGFVYSS